MMADADAGLAEVLRENLFLTGTKIGCGKGECGACSVIMNGKVVRSCITRMKNVPDDAAVTTIEGVGTPQSLHALQVAWIAHNGAQCGFCTPGFIVSAKALLDENQQPTREEVRDWFQKHHNACRCTGYKPLVDAVMDAARVIRGELRSEDLAFKMPADGKIWGTKHPRPTAVAQGDGHARLRRRSRSQATEGRPLPRPRPGRGLPREILSIDTSEAEKMPGVFRVLTHKDVKGPNRIIGLINNPDEQERRLGPSHPVRRQGLSVRRRHRRRLRRHGGPCTGRGGKVKVELKELPAYMSAPAAMAPDAIEIHPGTPNVYFTMKNVKGADTQPIMATAPYVVEDEFYTQRQPHMVIEPDVGLAYMEDDGVLVIYSKSTALHLHYAMIQPGIGIAPDKLIILNPPGVGGMFGYKLSPTSEALLGVACMATGRPVVLKYDY